MNNTSNEANTGHFPSRVMAVLNEEEVHVTMHWLPNGKAFIVRNTSDFSETVLKKHFKGIKPFSFIRSLSHWGFDIMAERTISGRCKSYTFSSPLFVRDQPELCKMMVRMARKDWKGFSESRHKSKQCEPVPLQPKQDQEPERSEERCNVPLAQAYFAQIPLPFNMPTVSSNMLHMHAVILLGQPNNSILSMPSIPQMMHQFPTIQPNDVVRQVSLASEPPNEAQPNEKPKANEGTVTIRKQNGKVTLSRSELNAAIAMSMLDEVN